jgi:hypothetical protein
MPSAPNSNSPYIDSQLQALFGARTPGSPSTAGNPAPQAGQPQFPAPPAPATGVQGRPANGGIPSPISFPAPPTRSGQVIDRAPQFGGQVIDRAPQMDGQVIDRGRAGQVIDRGPSQSGQVIDRAPQLATAPPILTSVPTPQQLALTPPGTPIQSLLGTTTQDEAGKERLMRFNGTVASRRYISSA